ncbi:AI-2E family transporter [Listeria fleischmannii]|jgi:predicted PurR-regulated permease PerM|uniref:AI-2E family transporter n=1 Tax=Listeria fleischmannii TaxID=1069827 RepID=A0A841YIN3_9LIST|nr:AI-2E family transporter [Listeria fleischmannii]MBC1420022.1 AI-2E family transporter [Listeria fleischmannii]MBC1428126.1 AI-2E family transporter [Listeria fleischmannii]
MNSEGGLLDSLIQILSKKSTRRILVFLAVVFVLYLLRSMMDIILLTFIFSFLITRLENFILKRISIYRQIIVLILYALIALGLAFVVVKYIPILTEQISQLVKFINTFFTQDSNNDFVNYVITMANEVDVMKYTEQGVQIIVTYLTNISVVAFNVFIALILSLFFSLGRDQLITFTNQFATSKISFVYEEIKYFGTKFVATFGKVIEAQFLIAVVNCVLTTIALWIMGFPQLLTLSIMVFLLGLIPVAGVIISMIPLTIIAYSVGGFQYVFYILLVVLVIHALESYVLNPKLMSAKTDLPVFYTFVILIFGEHFFGVWGLIVGIPVVMFFLDVLGVTDQAEHLLEKKQKT